MLRHLLLLFVLCLSIQLATCSDSTADVLVLNEPDFDEALQLHGTLLVKFYAPWCAHSQALAPEWEKAAEQLASSPMRIAKVDCDENKDLAEKYNVKAFPTIKFFRNGVVSEYTGGRTASDIAAWSYRKVIPKTHFIKSEAELAAFQEQHDIFALGVFKQADTETALAYQALADDDDLYVYALTTDEAIKSKLFYPRKIVDKEFVIVFKPFDEMRADLALTGKFSAEKVSTFVKTQSTPPIQEFTPATMRKIAQSPIKQHLLFFTDKTAPHHTQAMEVYNEVSVEFRTKLLFISVASTDTKIMEYFNITPMALPAMVIIDFTDPTVGMKKYPYTGTLSVAEISDFANSVVTGKAEPAGNATTSSSSGGNAKKSEEVSPEDTTGNVVVVRGASFEDIVLRSEQDVLLEFYAPWCGHCKNLAPTWEELGQRMKPNRNIIIAKIDFTANDVDLVGATITGFPTVLLFPRGNKASPVVYTGKRDLASFVAFIEAHQVDTQGGGRVVSDSRHTDL